MDGTAQIGTSCNNAGFDRIYRTELGLYAGDPAILHQTGMELFNELWTGQPIRLLGLRTSKLSDAPVHQMDLFVAASHIRHQKLDKALDAIRQKYGDSAIIRGSSLTSPSENDKRDD